MTNRQKKRAVATKHAQVVQQHTHENHTMCVVKNTGHNCVAIVATAVLFVTIGLVTAFLGWCLHAAEANFTWMPHWCFTIGYILEGGVFVLDCVGFAYSVVQHFLAQIKKH